MNKIPTDRINELKVIIANQLSDSISKDILSQFINYKATDLSILKNYKSNSITSSYYIALTYLIKIVGSHSIRELSWKSYCYDINYISDIYNQSITSTIKQATKFMRILTKEYYKFVLSNPPIITLEIIELMENKELLDLKEKVTNRRPKEYSTFVAKNIFTNFPLNSNIKNIYIYKYQSNSIEEKSVDTTIYFKYANTFIRQALINFIKSFPTVEAGQGGKARAAKIHYRQFFYYFSYSLYAFNFETSTANITKNPKEKISTLPECVQDFTFITFNRQYRFYKMLDKKFCLLSKQKIKKKNGEIHLKYDSTLDILKEFYIFLCRHITYNNIEHNPFAGTSISAESLVSPHFRKHYESGYYFIHMSPFEDVPKRNKWAIILRKEDESADSTTTNEITSFDFIEIHSKDFANDLKKFIWNYSKSTSVKTLKRMFYNIKIFLNLKHEYETIHKKVLLLRNNSEFSEDFMLFYRDTIIGEHGKSTNSTTAHMFSHVRIFLKYIQNKYNILQNIFLYLQLRNTVRDKIGGNPISKDDFNLIKKEFIKLKNGNDLDKLYFIIFNLCATTSLRLGSVVNLKRNCVLSVDENKSEGTIKYTSKTMQHKKAERTLTIDKIRLIEQAIELTSELEKNASNEEKKYIFITKIQKFNRGLEQFMVTRFPNKKINKVFTQILENCNIDKDKYTVNHLRHTYKDAIWKEGIKAGISTLVLEYMTDSSFKNDVLNYRARTDASRYAEMFSGVSISEVDIYGNIINDNEVDKLNPVEEGLGACKQIECIKFPSEDKIFRCLKCDSFVTCASRLPLFKRNIINLKQKIENTINEEEQNFYISELKLNTAFYSELLELSEKGVKR
ncbi:hypothetical protein [Clostridium beijerinckii]|uniref:Integrase n=1 Tax=Clostridium beijerinckii TaxID=1520 RepID=A0AAX0B0Z8_CLOBE|nr:hypothetical protein [Clostridium beijerinckii]NRT88909.1 integrase [Clostridium beijerinckii]NYC74364.1 integrase [Clostridium beijerinckii]